MKYPAEHWNKIAEMVARGLTAEQIQDHYPDTTVKTVKTWMRRVR